MLPEIRGPLLRQLLLGQVLPGHSEPAAIPLTGVRLSGARITGGLNLADFAKPGTGLPALVLENCIIEGELNLTGARVARLSVRNSRFTCIRLREAEIDGPFEFSNARPLEHSDLAWIDARDGLFHGQVTGKFARLAAPATWDVPDENPNALWLNDIDVRGSLMLMGLEAKGGVGIAAAHIRSNVVLRRAKLTSGAEDALMAQNARVGGSLIADNGFEATGRVWLLGAHIGNAVQLSGSKVSGPAGAPPSDVARSVAIILQNTRIGTNLFIDDAVVNGQILLRNSQIGGDFDCSRLILNPMPSPSDQGSSGQPPALLDATGVRVAGNVAFNDTFVRGRLDLTAIDISGSLSFVRAALMNRRFGDGTATALSLVNASVGKDADFGEAVDTGSTAGVAPGPRQDMTDVRQLDIEVVLQEEDAAQTTGPQVSPRLDICLRTRATAGHAPAPRPAGAHRLSSATDVLLLPLHPGHDAAGLLMRGSHQPARYALVVEGAVDMTGATFNKDLTFADCIFDNWVLDGSGAALSGDRMRVVGTLSFQGVRFLGRLNLPAADIGRDARFRDMMLLNAAGPVRPGDAIYAKDLKVGANCEFDNAVIVGNAILERLEVIGSLSWSGVAAFHPSPASGKGIVDLGMAEIGTALKPKTLALGEDMRLSLGGASAAQLELWWPGGWGGAPRDRSDRRLDLDGFEYQRLVFAETATRKDAGTWLACHERGTGFSPQPYRQLAAVLRAQGNEAAARYISVKERWRTPQPWWLYLFWWIYGAFFGFGFKPAAALLTLVGWVAVGTGFVWIAKAEGILKQSVVVTSSAVSEVDENRTRNVFQVAPAAATKFLHELPCADAAIGPIDDVIFAVDMILPFIPLHQQSRCEISAGEVFVTMANPSGAASETVEVPRNVGLWRFARAAYTVIGWIIVSLSLITFAGVVKRTEAADGD